MIIEYANLVAELKKNGFVEVNQEQYDWFKENADDLFQYLDVKIVNGEKTFVLMNKKGFDYLFWKKYIDAKENGDLTENNLKTVRINGSHYVIGGENSSGFSGHGGARFVIEFIDGPHKGQIIETTNLWHQGGINKEYIDQLPDNAKWVKQWA